MVALGWRANVAPLNPCVFTIHPYIFPVKDFLQMPRGGTAWLAYLLPYTTL